jgi:uroporphyrinogen-III synthase
LAPAAAGELVDLQRRAGAEAICEPPIALDPPHAEIRLQKQGGLL